MKARALQLAVIMVLASLAVVGRLALVWLPNVSVSFLALAVAGLFYGVRVGAAVGLIGRLASDLVISGLNPILLPMTFVEGGIGALLGVLGHWVRMDKGSGPLSFFQRLLLFDLGLGMTVLHSVLSDSVTWVFYNLVLLDAPDAARGTLWTTLVFLGLAFNVMPAIVHGLLFAAAIPPIGRGLRAAGLIAGTREHPEATRLQPAQELAPPVWR
jgi:hypothetical protein